MTTIILPLLPTQKDVRFDGSFVASAATSTSVWDPTFYAHNKKRQLDMFTRTSDNKYIVYYWEAEFEIQIWKLISATYSILNSEQAVINSYGINALSKKLYDAASFTKHYTVI